MKVRPFPSARYGLFLIAAIWMIVVVPLSLVAAPYAAVVMDARTGEILHSRNADTRLHPASLTKMMTLYIAFEAIERGEISLDTKVRISKKAAAEPPSKLGLKAGQRIALRYLIRASAVKSANDAATAIGEAISGSEAAFARRMNRTAKALGMTRTTFKNAHGLTEKGHMSTARDMTILGRHVLYDYPQYYNLFSRTSTHAGITNVANTNRKLLANYRGADGIKTGYTRAAGFNLVASAERRNERVIATMFGGKSAASRNARVAELLDMGFRRAPNRAKLRKPEPPRYNGRPPAAKTVRVSGQIGKSMRPRLRPGTSPEPETIMVAKTATSVADDDIQQALSEAASNVALAENAEARAKPEAVAMNDPMLRPVARSRDIVIATEAQETAQRITTSGGRYWGVNVGRFPSRFQAEKMLLQTALTEMVTLEGSLRKVVHKPQGFDANFMGLSRETADLACRRLTARNIPCKTIGPS